MPRGRLIAITGLALLPLLAACAVETNLGARQQGGMAPGTTGSVAAAPAGNMSGANPASGIFGGAMGGSLDEQDRQRAFAAEIQALEFGEPGSPVGWRSESGGRRGTVVPGAYYEGRGTRCRDISHTVYIDNRPQIVRGTACRNADGTWSPTG